MAELTSIPQYDAAMDRYHKSQQEKKIESGIETINRKIAAMQNSLLELAGKIEFQRLETRIKMAEIENLEGHSRLMAAEIKGLRVEVGLLMIELDSKNLTNPRNYISEKEER